MTRLCIVLATLVVIARARIALLPGWVVPLPVLILAAETVFVAAAAAWLVLYLRANRTGTAAPCPVGERSVP